MYNIDYDFVARREQLSPERSIIIYIIRDTLDSAFFPNAPLGMTIYMSFRGTRGIALLFPSPTHCLSIRHFVP